MNNYKVRLSACRLDAGGHMADVVLVTRKWENLLFNTCQM